MPSSYSASYIEVLSCLDPVRRRPGMYTDTTRPNCQRPYLMTDDLGTVPGLDVANSLVNRVLHAILPCSIDGNRMLGVSYARAQNLLS